MTQELGTSGKIFFHDPEGNLIAIDLKKIHEEGEIHIKDLEEAATLTDVQDEASARHALSMALQSRKLKNTAKESKEKLLRPILDYQKAVNTLVSDLNAKLESIEDRLQNKIATWMDKENENNIFYDMKELEVEDGKISKKTSWDYEVYDEQAIPREFLSVDHAKIKLYVKTGARVIPGVIIEEKTEYQMRVNNK
jgi:hypothetical protein